MATKNDLIQSIMANLDQISQPTAEQVTWINEIRDAGPVGLAGLTVKDLQAAAKKVENAATGAGDVATAAATAVKEPVKTAAKKTAAVTTPAKNAAAAVSAVAKKNPIRNVGRVTAIEAREQLNRLAGIKLPAKQRAAVTKLTAMLDKVIKGEKIAGTKAEIMSKVTPLLRSHGLIRPATGAAAAAAATKVAATTGAGAAGASGAAATLGQGEAASQIAAAVKAFSKPGMMSSLSQGLQASPLKTLAGPAILAYLAYNLWSKSQEQGLAQSGAEEEMASMESPELMMLKAMVPQMGQKTAAMQNVSQQMLQRSPWLSPIPGEVVT